MRLVPDWKSAWRWLSVQFMTLAAAAEVAWRTLPPEALAVIPPDWQGYITLGLILAGLIGRMIDQRGRA